MTGETTETTERPLVDDRTFMENVREARDNGYDLCCTTCGCGIQDASDWHETACPEFRDLTRLPSGAPA